MSEFKTPALKELTEQQTRFAPSVRRQSQIARSDSRSKGRDVQSCRSATDRDRVSRADPLSQLRLEALDCWTLCKEVAAENRNGLPPGATVPVQSSTRSPFLGSGSSI